VIRWLDVTRAEPRAVRAVAPGPVPRLLPAGLVLVALTEAALAQGGGRAWPAAFVAVLLTAAVAASGVAPRWSRFELARLGVVPALGLGAWALLRGAASPVRTSGIGAAALIVGVLAVIALVRRMSTGEERWFVDCLLIVGVLVAATGWIGVVFRIEPWGHPDGTVWRAATCLTYENAAAALLVPLALVALGRAVGPDRGATLRQPAVMATILLVGAGATLSRAGAVALVLGLVVLTVLLGRSALRLVPPLVGAAAGFCALLPSAPVGRASNQVVAAGGLVAAMAISVASVRVAGAVGLGGLAGLGILASTTSDRWLQIAAARLAPGSVDRTDEVRAALARWHEQPVVGVAPGQATLHWHRPGGLGFAAVYAHNEYVQIAAELGAIGLVLLAAWGVAVVRRVREGRARGGRRTVYAGAVAGIVAFLVHSSQDFLWHVPVVPMTVAALIAVATRKGDAP